MQANADPAGRRSPADVRLADVAALAGVSIGTASKALNGTGQLRAETRARVTRAAERLGFTTNTVARGLASGRTFTVGVLTTDSFGRFSIPVMMGAEDALGEGQVAVMLCDTRDDPLRERHYVQALRGRRVDGIIVTGRRTEPRTPLGQVAGGAVGVPVVYAFTPSADAADCSVVSDDAAGTRLAVEHLIDLGRTRFAIVTGPAHHRAATNRAEAATAALAAAGLEPAMPVRFGEWSEAWGRRAAAAVARGGVDAVVCGSDQVGRGVVDGLREVGCRVPDEVAVVGFDNWDVMAMASRPPLTTVDMQLQALGQRAAGLLLDSIDGRPTPGLHTMPCELVVRGSTQPA